MYLHRAAKSRFSKELIRFQIILSPVHTTILYSGYRRVCVRVSNSRVRLCVPRNRARTMTRSDFFCASCSFVQTEYLIYENSIFKKKIIIINSSQQYAYRIK